MVELLKREELVASLPRDGIKSLRKTLTKHLLQVQGSIKALRRYLEILLNNRVGINPNPGVATNTMLPAPVDLLLPKLNLSPRWIAVEQDMAVVSMVVVLLEETILSNQKPGTRKVVITTTSPLDLPQLSTMFLKPSSTVLLQT